MTYFWSYVTFFLKKNGSSLGIFEKRPKYFLEVTYKKSDVMSFDAFLAQLSRPSPKKQQNKHRDPQITADLCPL